MLIRRPALLGDPLLYGVALSVALVCVVAAIAALVYPPPVSRPATASSRRCSRSPGPSQLVEARAAPSPSPRGRPEDPAPRRLGSRLAVFYGVGGLGPMT